MGFFPFFSSSRASTALTAQSILTQKHTHTRSRLLSCESKCAALPGLSNVANMALFSPFSSQPSELLSVSLRLIFIFPQNFNYRIPRLPLSLCSVTDLLFLQFDFKVLTFWILLWLFLSL